MPLIAYIYAHGQNDFPLHFAFFEALERRGVLDRFDFVIDTWFDPDYCLKLVERFPQLLLSNQVSPARRAMRTLADRVGRGYRPLALLDRFDAVCQGPGGRIHPLYMGRQSVFRLYPRVRRRAIAFQSIESGVLEQPAVRASIAGCDLVIARTGQSAVNAVAAGAPRVVTATDIVFHQGPSQSGARTGVAAALRLPNQGVTTEYQDRVWEIIEGLETSQSVVDFVLVEGEVGDRMRKRGYGTMLRPNTGLYFDDGMYRPFMGRRDAVISSRLHTTLLALLHGNRKILQFQIESQTNKVAEMLRDIGIQSVSVLGAQEARWPFVRDFLDAGPTIPETEVTAALAKARSLVEAGLDAFTEWLDSLTGKTRSRVPLHGAGSRDRGSTTPV